jgi:hypothetical protein
VRTLHLSARSPAIDGQVKSDEREPGADRFRRWPRMLGGVRINGFLVEEVRAGTQQVVRRQLLEGGVALRRCLERRLDRSRDDTRLRSAGRTSRGVHTANHAGAWDQLVACLNTRQADDLLTRGSTVPHAKEPTMPATHFTVHTSLSPSEVLALFTDFGPDRASVWPNVDAAHFKVHDQGPDWAEVTEGTAMGWERERYTWDAAAGTVAIDTLDSNLWGPGSSWRYELRPAGDGTDVHVTLTRVPKSLRGRILGALIPIAGARALGKQFQSVLRKAESR